MKQLLQTVADGHCPLAAATVSDASSHRQQPKTQNWQRQHYLFNWLNRRSASDDSYRYKVPASRLLAVRFDQSL